MSDNTKEAPLTEQKSELIYKLEDRPPVKEALFAAFQHLLAIFVAIITPPLIIAGALKLDLETTSYLISMSLLASGISTFIQCRRIGPIGCGLLCIQGTSFSFYLTYHWCRFKRWTCCNFWSCNFRLCS